MMITMVIRMTKIIALQRERLSHRSDEVGDSAEDSEVIALQDVFG